MISEFVSGIVDENCLVPILCPNLYFARTTP